MNVPQGEHFTFTDYQVFLPQLGEQLGVPDSVFVGASGTVHPERVVASQRAYVAAFFDRHLRGDAGDLLDGLSPLQPDVAFVR